MCHTAVQAFSLLLVLVMVVECDSAGLATSTALCSLTQEELVMSVIVNQKAILKYMNESSCVCASRDDELRELRLMKEEVRDEVETMKKIKSELEVMKAEINGQLTAMKETLEAVRNTSVITPSQQPDPAALTTLHNDADPSLCGPNKVLFGSKGSISPSHPLRYRNNMYCEWHVILPEGTRPVFRWEYFQMQNGLNCQYDGVRVRFPRISRDRPMCGNEAPSQHSMYNITDDEFFVSFRSDNSGIAKGFLLHYHAEINNVSN